MKRLLTTHANRWIGLLALVLSFSSASSCFADSVPLLTWHFGLQEWGYYSNRFGTDEWNGKQPDSDDDCWANGLDISNPVAYVPHPYLLLSANSLVVTACIVHVVGDFHIGTTESITTGATVIQDGATLNHTNSAASLLLESGTYTITAGLLSATNAYVGGSQTVGSYGGVLNVGNYLPLLFSGTAIVSGTLKVWNNPTNAVNLSGGTLSVGVLDLSGNNSLLNWTGGTLAFTNTPEISVDASSIFGTSLTLGVNAYGVQKGLSTTQNLTVPSGSSVTVSGGSLSAGFTMTIDGTSLLSSGTVTASNGLSIAYAGDGTFTQTGGTNNPYILYIGSPGKTGQYQLSAGTLNVTSTNSGLVGEEVGFLGNGIFSQTGGTHNVLILELGQAVGAAGRYDMSSGQLNNTGYESVAYNGTGIFNQSGGTHGVSRSLYLGGPMGTGTFSLSGGNLTVSESEYIGSEGTGNFIQTNGTNSVNGWVWIGNNAGSNGTYLMHGGMLTTKDIRTDSGQGTFTMDGGYVTFGNGGWIHAGVNPGSVANYTITGGTANNPGSGLIVIGESGTGSFNIGGNAIVTSTANQNHLIFGLNTSGVGNVHVYGNASLSVWDIRTDYGHGTFVQDGGSVTAGGWFRLGIVYGSVSTYTLNHGSATLQLLARIGEDGTGTLNINGGTMTVAQDFDVGSDIGSGTVNLTGGSLTVSAYEYVGHIGTGTFNQTGGNASALYLHTGEAVGAVGAYLLQDGTLNVTSTNYIGEMVGASGSGTFTQSGGTHTPYTIYIAAWPQSHGTYTLTGGVLTVGSNESIGWLGSGTFVHSGGTNTVNAVLLVGDALIGSYTLSGTGSLVVKSTEYVGYSGTGAFTQTGGTNTITNNDLVLGANSGSSGAYTLNGGKVSGRNLIVGQNGTGVLTVHGGTLTFASLQIKSGSTFITNGGSIIITGSAANNGTMRLTGTTPLSVSGTFTNNGVLDVITGPQTLPAKFVNHGTVLLASGVQVKQCTISGSNAQLTIQSYPGHNYQLQRRDTLISGSWQNIGSAQAGSGSVLTFTDPGGATGTQRFYRFFVSP